MQGVGVRDAEPERNLGLLPQSVGARIGIRPEPNIFQQWPISPVEATESVTSLM